MSRDAAERVRHDVGKYVVFEVAWLPPDAGPAALRDALRSDLLATRRGPDGATGAVALWRALRPGLPDAPEVAELDDRFRALERGLPALDAEPPDPDALRALAATAEAIRASCYAWAERARRS